MNPKKPLVKRIGEVGYNNLGSKMTIIDYFNKNNIIVQFEDGYITQARYSNFKRHHVGNPYDKSVCGVGYLGEGTYKAVINRKRTLFYMMWGSMLLRCYDRTSQKNYSSYKDCSVCEEWKNYQNFAKWCEENFYQLENFKMQLDKDILMKNNKMYSPETCIFVPQFINSLFTKTDINRGKYPIGVYEIKNVKILKYGAQCNNGKKKQIRLGAFSTPEEAFYAYKEYKENLIKQIADQYKNQIPQKLYDALYRYEVEITD